MEKMVLNFPAALTPVGGSRGVLSVSASRALG